MKAIDIDDVTLRKMQLLQLEMLIEVDRICRKKDIRYVICDGTLLGAVRHKGFIPWDDDIDIRMERKEYEKFWEACKEELDTSKFFFQDHKTDSAYPWYYGKIRYLNTEYIRSGQEHLKMKTGIFIDILPMDGVPNSIWKQKVITKVCFILKKILYANVGYKVEDNIFNKVGYWILAMIPNKITFKLLDTIAQKYKDDKHENVESYALIKWKKTKYSKRVWYLERIELEFEKGRFYAPKDYEAWLKYAYGDDYMELPPVEKRKIHSIASKISVLD